MKQKNIEHMSDAVLKGQIEGQNRKIAEFETMEDRHEVEDEAYKKAVAYRECLLAEKKLRDEKSK